MRFPRSGGVLAHPTSFPGRYGIGDLGGAAYNFVDFLVKGRQSIWQILPLGPTGYGDSPYQSFSSFAGNPLLISPDKLVEDGFLSVSDLRDVPSFPKDKVDFGWVIDYKGKLLKHAFEQFDQYGPGPKREAFESFCEAQADWLDDFALFMALKNYHVAEHGGVWNTWPEDIAKHKPEAIKWWSQNLAGEVRMHKFLQYLFFDQWLALKSYANDHGIKIVGDIPIFVAFDSADVWANSDLFFLHEDGSPEFVAGVPPDYFSETGQRWGNPLYRWQKMKDNDYAWWTKRLQMSFTQADIIRIDHFRGFEAYWQIPASEETAVVGEWVKGPAHDFFEAMQRNLGELPLIAEDLGVITDEVIALRERFDFPGMKILQFAFGGERNSDFLPHNFGKNCVVYTGTHDNETVRGWFGNASEDEKRHVLGYLNVDNGENIAWDLTRLAYASVADTAVSTLQDLMNLGNEARMNFPGKSSGNWQWRYQVPMLSDDIAGRLAEMTAMYGRD